MEHRHPSNQRRWANQPVVRERDRDRVRWLWKLLLGIVVALTPFAGWLLQQNEFVSASYRVNHLRTAHEELVEQARRLQHERATRESLGSIEEWAVTEEGLQRPAPEQVVNVIPATPLPADWLARAPDNQPRPN